MIVPAICIIFANTGYAPGGFFTPFFSFKVTVSPCYIAFSTSAVCDVPALISIEYSVVSLCVCVYTAQVAEETSGKGC